MKRLSKQLRVAHFIIHYDLSWLSSNIQKLFFLLYCSQLLNLIGKYSPQSDMITIFNIIQGMFIFPLLDYSYLPRIQIILFIMNLIISLNFIAIIVVQASEKRTILTSIIKIIHIIINVYPSLLFIPIVWINIKLCFEQDVLQFLLAILNLLIALLITFLVIFFQRGDTLLTNENQTNFKVILKILSKILEFITIYIQFYDTNISFIMIIVILIYIIVNNIQEITEAAQVRVVFTLATLMYAIIIKLSLYLTDFLLCFSIILYCYNQIYQNRINNILYKGETILSCQIAEYLYKISLFNKEARLKLQIFKNSHKCSKCKAFYDMIECILRKKCLQKHEKLIYANFIAKKWILRALVELLQGQTGDMYFQSAMLTFQKLNKKKTQVSEIIKMHYNTQIISEEIVKSFIKIINIQLNFWIQQQRNQFLLQDFYKQGQNIGKEIQLLTNYLNTQYNIKLNKLKMAIESDSLTMRILQIFYSIINVDVTKAIILEDKISSLFKSDKFKEFKTLDNNQLATNRQLILTASLIQNRDKLIKPNYQQISNFLGIQLDEANLIRSSNQFLPQFISNIHEQLIEHFIQSGQSKMMQGGIHSFYQDSFGFIVPCYLHLFPIQMDDDYLINIIISKEYNVNDAIIFGMNGKLFGISKHFFNFTQSNSYLDNYSKAITINDLINRGSLIQYYIDNIYQKIQELKKSIEKHQNYLLTDIKSIWKYPENHQNFIINTGNLLKQQQSSSNKFQSFSNFMSQKTFLQISKQSDKTIQLSDIDEDQEQINKDLLLDGVEWKILSSNLNTQIKNMLLYQEIQSTTRSQLILNYSLTFRLIQIGKKPFGYFVMDIKDYKSEQILKQSATIQLKISSPQNQYTLQSSSSYQIPEIEDIHSERTNIDQDVIQQIQQMNQKNHLTYLNKLEYDRITAYNNYMSSISQTKQKLQSYDFENSSRLSKIQTDRQPKKLLLTTKIELNSMNIQHDEEDIMQQVENEFQEIGIINKYIENQEELDISEEKEDFIIRQKTKTKNIIQEKKQNNTLQQSKSLKDISQYLELITNKNYKLLPLKKFIYFSFCVILILISNIISESIQSVQEINNNKQIIDNLLQSLLFYENNAIKFNLLLSQNLYKLNLININNILIDEQINQLNNTFTYNTYDISLKFVNNFQQLNNINITQNSFYQYYLTFEDTLQQIYQNLSKELQFNNDTFIIFYQINQNIQQQLDNYSLSSLDYTTLSIFTLLYILFIFYQAKYLIAKNKILTKILKLMQLTDSIKISNQIARLQTIKETLENNNMKTWKLSSYPLILQESFQSDQIKKKQNFDLEGKLNSTFIYINILVIIVLIAFIIIGALLKQFYYNYDYLYLQLNIIELISALDETLLYGSIIKGYQGLNNSINISIQANIIQQFNISFNKQLSLLNSILNYLEILQEYEIQNKIINQWCQSYQTQMSICDQQSFLISTQIYSLMENGLISIINNIQQIVNTDFIEEIMNNQFLNKDQVNSFLQSQSFINTFVLYFIDFVNILQIQIQEIIQIGNNNYQTYIYLISTYEVGIGLLIIILYMTYGYIVQNWHNQDFQHIILFFKILPNEQLQMKNILHQVKNIIEEK